MKVQQLVYDLQNVIRLMGDEEHEEALEQLQGIVIEVSLLRDDEKQSAELELEQVKGERDAFLTNDVQNVDEFNAGFDAYNSGKDLDNAEEFYRACKREEGVPSYDSFSTGYAWAKFTAERAAALKDAK